MKQFFLLLICIAIIIPVHGISQWLEQPTGSTVNNLQSVSFVDSLTGYVGDVDNSNLILKTTNSGVNWQQISVIGIINGNGMAEICFTSRDTGFIGTRDGYLGKTVDGGTTWKTVAALKDFYFGQNGIPFTGIFFITPQIGWAVGGSWGAFIKTTDGGETWQKGDDSQVMFGYILRAVHFVDTSVGWVAGGWGSTILCKTTDGGKTLVQQILPLNNFQVEAIYAIDSNVCFIVQWRGANSGKDEEQGRVSKTTDGGKTWITVLSSNIAGFSDVKFVDHYSPEGGSVKGKIGWVLAAWIPSVYSTSMIYKTTDGGTSWSVQDTSQFNQVYEAMTMINENLGWFVGRGGVVKKTTNGGGDKISAIQEQAIKKNGFLFSESYPNPAVDHAGINLYVPQSQFVRIELVDMLGRPVHTLYEGMATSGDHKYDMKTTEMHSGVYVCRLFTNTATESRIIIVKK